MNVDGLIAGESAAGLVAAITAKANGPNKGGVLFFFKHI